MDAVVLGFISVFSLILILLSYLGKGGPSWALFAFFGALIMGYGALSLLADGNLTSGTTTLASANGSLVSDFSTITLIPIMLCIGGCIICIKRTFKL